MLPQFSAWVSMNSVDLSITKIIDESYNHSLLSSDFSGFDQSVVDQQAWYFDYMKSVYQDKYREDIAILENYFKAIPILCTKSVAYGGEHGVPSGSTFTNQADSIVNYVAQISSPELVSERTVQVQGDDAVLAVNNVDNHLEHLSALGFDANKTKQLVSNETVSYLQRTYYRHYRPDGICRGIYPTMRALNSLLGQERFYKDWSSMMVSLRVIAILENVKWHPAFNEFVKFVVREGDPRLKENTLELIENKAKWLRQASEVPGLIPSYNQEGQLQGIESFASVQRILSL